VGTLVRNTRSKRFQFYGSDNSARWLDYYYASHCSRQWNSEHNRVGPRGETGKFAVCQPVPASRCIVQTRSESSGLVRVVPNPATVAAGALGFAGTPDKILFVNLPLKCKLRIYTETGDHVKSIEHYGTADHEWDQRTDDNQYVSSGIYILVVTDAEDLNGKPLDSQFVKFILVR